MKRGLLLSLRITLTILLAGVLVAPAQDLKPIQLPTPQTEGGRPLMQVLKDRKTTREFGSEKLSLQTVSNLLWAAFGVNRPTGQRTAPSAVNWQEIDVYVVLPEGLFIYDAKANALRPVLAEDIRAATGTQAYPKDAPVNLIYVADYDKPGRVPETEKDFWSAADVGYISQNVYLFSASEGLVSGVRALIDRPALAKIMKLRPKQKILLAQSVGYPKK
jgi:nitroreductase